VLGQTRPLFVCGFGLTGIRRVEPFRRPHPAGGCLAKSTNIQTVFQFFGLSQESTFNLLPTVLRASFKVPLEFAAMARCRCQIDVRVFGVPRDMEVQTESPARADLNFITLAPHVGNWRGLRDTNRSTAAVGTSVADSFEPDRFASLRSLPGDGRNS